MAGHAYVSYCRQDVGYARQLVEHLTAAGLPVRVDQHVSEGAAWEPTLQGPIWSAAVMVVVMTPDSQESDRVRGEILYAHSIGKPIVPLLLAGKAYFSQGGTGAIDVTGGRMPDDAVLDRLGRLCDVDVYRPVVPEPTKRHVRAPILVVAAVLVALVAGIGVAVAVSRPGSGGAGAAPVDATTGVPPLSAIDPTSGRPLDPSSTASARPSASGSRKPTTSPPRPSGGTTGPAGPAEPALTGLAVDPVALILDDANASAKGTVTIAAAATSDVTVTLTTSGTGAVSVPGDVTIPAGQDHVDFNVIAGAAGSVIITAQLHSQVVSSPTVTITEAAA